MITSIFLISSLLLVHTSPALSPNMRSLQRMQLALASMGNRRYEVTPRQSKPVVRQNLPSVRDQTSVAHPQWPSKVLGLYILLADDSEDGFGSDADWTPELFEWQQEASNVLFFTFKFAASGIL